METIPYISLTNIFYTPNPKENKKIKKLDNTNDLNKILKNKRNLYKSIKDEVKNYIKNINISFIKGKRIENPSKQILNSINFLTSNYFNGID